jgi:anthranilate synthase component 2
MLLLLDNYDSFTYNLVHYLQELMGEEVAVHRNDQIPLEEVARFDRVVLSPGPGLPAESGIMMPLIRLYAGKIPMLGVCLGHQAITEAFGGGLRRLDGVLHGLVRQVHVTADEHELFEGIESPFDTGRYHSWVPDEATFPEVLQVIARDDDGCIMALKHRELPVYGVQFHPESVMTPCGKQMLANWLALTAPKTVSLT